MGDGRPTPRVNIFIVLLNTLVLVVCYAADDGNSSYCDVTCEPKRHPAPVPFFEKDGKQVTSFYIECSIKANDSCEVDLFQETNLTSHLENSTSTSMIEIALKCPRNQQVVVNFKRRAFGNGTRVHSKSPAVWLHIYACVVPWDGLSHFAHDVNLTVLNALFSNYSGLKFSVEGVNPDGFKTIGTFGTVAVLGAHYIAKALNIFEWSSLTEMSFFRTSFRDEDFTDRMTTLLPILQTLEVEHVRLTKPLTSFPWQPNTAKLPNGLARTHFFNDRHYGKGLRIAPNIYRRVLRLDYTQIHNLTGYVFSGFLHRLSLAGNRLREIPPQVFSGLTGLQALELRNNLITTIPDGLFDNVSSLLELNLGQNLIAEIGAQSLSQLVNLQTLNLQKNKIRIIRKCYFTGLRSLETLNLEFNAIEFIEKDSLTAEASKLKFVFLKGNRLASFPVAMFIKLISLDLSHNFITFDNLNETLESVNYADIEMQNINSLSDSNYLDARKTPKTLVNLQHNNITTLVLDSLTEMQFRTFASILNYFHFDLSANEFVCDCKVFSLYKFINNPVKTIESPTTATKFEVRIETGDFSTWKCATPSAVNDLPIGSVPNTTFECLTKMADCPSPCDCLLRSVDHSVTVNCSGRNMKALPPTVPHTENELVLHVEDNFIRHVGDLDYLEQVTHFYASRNNISDISENVLKKMKKVKVLHLDSNKLSTLPRYIEHMTNHLQLSSLNIKHNFFDCDCHSLWTKYWLRNNLAKFVEAQNVLCSSGSNKGKAFIYVPDDKFICELLAGEVAAIALGTIITIFLIIVVSVYRHRQEVKVLLYAKFNWHPFDRLDRDNDDTKIYDAFISYCSKDYRFVCHNLRVMLERNDPPYKLCIHDRDFLVGAPIYENVMNSVRLSKRMIMILSEDFLQSEWCMVEFRTAHQKVLKEHSSYLIVIILGDLDTANLDEELNLYLKTNTYLTVGDKLFLERLKYALPKPRSTQGSVDKSETITPL